MTPAPSISNMISQSREVLSKPSVQTFERFENQGSLREAVIYVGIAALITGLLNLTGGLSGFLSGIIATIIGFLVFTYLIFWIGKQQGGSGTYNQVAYSFALFWAPLSVIFAALALVLLITIIGIFLIPAVAIAALAANIYFAYLAIQSSMNLPAGSKVWLVLLVAAIGSFLVNLVVGLTLG